LITSAVKTATAFIAARASITDGLTIDNNAVSIRTDKVETRIASSRVGKDTVDFAIADLTTLARATEDYITLVDAERSLIS